MKEETKTLSIKLPEDEVENIRKEAAVRKISIAKYVRQCCSPEKYKSEIEWQNKKLSE